MKTAKFSCIHSVTAGERKGIKFSSNWSLYTASSQHCCTYPHSLLDISSLNLPSVSSLHHWTSQVSIYPLSHPYMYHRTSQVSIYPLSHPYISEHHKSQSTLYLIHTCNTGHKSQSTLSHPYISRHLIHASADISLNLPCLIHTSAIISSIHQRT